MFTQYIKMKFIYENTLVQTFNDAVTSLSIYEQHDQMQSHPQIYRSHKYN